MLNRYGPALPEPPPAVGRFRRRIASAPRSVLPADPKGLLKAAPSALPVLFDDARPVQIRRGPALLLLRDGMRFFLWPDGRWASACGRMKGGGMVSLVMAAADLDALDALVLFNVAASQGESFAGGGNR